MGQYHLVCNLDKKQFLHPHGLGDGLKLCEFGCSSGGTMAGLAYLLGVSAARGGRGGGDPRHDAEAMIGSWGGDRIAIVGDYAKPTDLPPEFNAERIYELCSNARYPEGGDDPEGWKDLTPMVRALLELNGDYEPGFMDAVS